MQDVFVGREAAKGLEPASVIVGVQEELQVASELVVALVVVAFDSRFLEGSVHPLDLPIVPRVVGLRQAVFDAVLVADPVEHVPAVTGCRARSIAGCMAELLPVVGQHRVDVVRHCLDQDTQEVRRDVAVGFRLQFGEGKLRGSVDRDEQVELAFLGSNLGDVDAEVADGVVREALRLGLVALHLGQPADPVTLEAAVERRSGEMRDRRLKPVKAVVE